MKTQPREKDMGSCRLAGGRVCLVVLAGAAGLSSQSWGVGIETIYTKVHLQPTAAIPGTVDLTGAAAPSEWERVNGMPFPIAHGPSHV